MAATPSILSIFVNFRKFAGPTVPLFWMLEARSSKLEQWGSKGDLTTTVVEVDDSNQHLGRRQAEQKSLVFSDWPKSGTKNISNANQFIFL